MTGRSTSRCDRHRHGVTGTGTVVLLPPGVAHDGRTVTAAGFRKRVLYLDATVLPEDLTGRAVDAPVFGDELLRHRIHQLHTSLGHAGRRVRGGVPAGVHPGAAALPPGRARGRRVRPAARRTGWPPRLRDLLDSRLAAGLSLHEAAAVLHAHPTHLIRCFKQTYGLPPHAYLTGKRIEWARGLLLDGRRPGGGRGNGGIP